MSRGSSGRIVVVVEPELKQELYVELARRGLTLKDWFVEQATEFIEASHQPSLFAGNQVSRHRRDVPSDRHASPVEDDD